MRIKQTKKAQFRLVLKTILKTPIKSNF